MSYKLYDLVGIDVTRPFSPHCWKVRMALAHKKLETESVPVTFTQIKTIEGGGYSKIPMIRNGEILVEDSFQIASYLEETYPNEGNSLFSGKASEGPTRFIESWSQTQLHPWVAKWALVDIYNMLGEDDQAYFRTSREGLFKMSLEDVVADRETRIADLKPLLMPIRVMLKSQPFIGGEHPQFADYIVFGAFQWLRVCSGLQMIEKDDPVMVWLNQMLDLHDGVGRSVSEANA